MIRQTAELAVSLVVLVGLVAILCVALILIDRANRP